jgi:hypothetical protein
MTILPLCPFPHPSWWKHARTPEAVVDVGEYYIHQTLRNRYYILGPNGVQVLTIPVVGQKGVKTPVRDIRIAEHGNWKREHLGALRAAYGKSAFYPFLEDQLRELYEVHAQDTLMAFSMKSIAVIGAVAGAIQPVISAMYVDCAEGDTDLRGLFRRPEQLPQGAAYPQVFADRFGYVGGLSVLDLVMNLGPRALDRL